MLLLRAYLLAGLLIHKGLWMALQRRDHTQGAALPPDGGHWLPLVKAVKVLVLLGLIAQTMLPEILPILDDGDLLRLIGVPIYTAGLVVAILGRLHLGDSWANIETARVGKNQALVSSGIYRYVRHPIYTGDLLLLFGFQLALNSWLVVVFAVLPPLVVRQALREESMLLDRLDGYDSYAKRTKRFVPFLV